MSFSKTNLSLIAFALVLSLPSTAIFQKYLGSMGAVVYIVIASIALLCFASCSNYFIKHISRMTERGAIILSAATLLLVFLVFNIIYPVANSGIVGGGSDSDDALNIAVPELLHGRYPYYLKTYLGNPVSPLPGALMLAVPFVLMGNSAYQNFFWLLIYPITTKLILRDQRSALPLLILTFVLSPAVLYAVLIGSDYLSNGLYVFVFMICMIVAVPRDDLAEWKKCFPSIFLGISLSSRANFILLLPLIVAFLVKRAGWKSAVKYTAVTIFTFASVTVPFYVYDPAGFTPLQTIDEINRFDSILPYAGILIPALTGIIALLLAAQLWKDASPSTLLKECTLVLAFPILCGMVLSSVQSGRLDFGFAFFGVFSIFFGVAAFWDDIYEKYRPVQR